MKSEARSLNTAPIAAPPAQVIALKVTPAPRRGQRWLRPLLQRLIPASCGLILLLFVWQLASMSSKGFPTPYATWQAAVTLFADPFYNNGPNDQGIGWNVVASLQRVAIGFGLAALVGVPAGFLIGRFTFIAHMLNPIIALLRPVSPLAWLPIGLLLF